MHKLFEAFTDFVDRLISSPTHCTQAALIAFVMSCFAKFVVVPDYRDASSVAVLTFLALFVLSHCLSGFFPNFCRSEQERRLSTDLDGGLRDAQRP